MKYLIWTLLILLSCKEKNGKAIRNTDNKVRQEILISSGQTEQYEVIKIKNIDFDLVVSETNDTIYLATNDKRFVTSEGFTVGTTFGQLADNLKNELSKENGWGYYVKLNSGWTLGFCEGSSCTDNHPIDSSEVKWIFKRK
jgi:hypothetical protein